MDLNGSAMRLATLLLCACLTACAGVKLPGEASAPEASVTAARPPVVASSMAGGGARGGATTAAARGEPVEVPPDPLTQARADCWMLVETQKGLRGIDQRIGFVDKCVADRAKNKPAP
jgi:hypothetical protein